MFQKSQLPPLIRLRYGIAIPFPVGKAAAQILEPRARARRVTLNHVDQVSTRRGRACMDIVGCDLASEQPVRLHDSIAMGCGRSKLLSR